MEPIFTIQNLKIYTHNYWNNTLSLIIQLKTLIVQQFYDGFCYYFMHLLAYNSFHYLD
jgi:hypothetical protein